MESKKILGVLVFLILLINFVSASDIAYIYRKSSEIDNNILNVFNKLGLSYELINEINLPSNFSDYKIIFVGNERFRNAKKIPVNEKPSVIMNYYYGNRWGLTDRDGISKLAGNAPLYVKKDGQVVKVYTQSEYSPGKVSIPYYYLDDQNKDSRMQTQARTYTGGNYTFGDVISYSTSGTETCFFGIIESDYWTSAAQQMFEECLQSVLVVCSSNEDCGEEKISEPYCMNKEVYKDFESYFCENSGTCNSECNKNFEVRLIEDCGENYCGNWSENYCSEGDTYHSRTCYENGCLLGGCFSNPSAEEDLVENCLNGCFNSSCVNPEPECIDEDCSPTECDNLDGCYGEDYYDYHDIENNCLEGACEESSCNDFNASYYDERCVETPAPICGNEILEVDEECDDGNLIDEDGCSANCEIESAGGVHDVGLVDFASSFGGIRLEYENNTDILENPAQLMCNQEYKISITAENFGNFTENVTFNGEVDGLIFNHIPKDNLTSGDDVLKYKIINFTLGVGVYNITVEAIIPVDDVPENNIASREIEIVC